MAEYVVTAAALVAKLPGAQGGERYFHRGDKLVGVNESECKRLVEIGLAEAEDEPEPEKPGPAAPRK